MIWYTVPITSQTLTLPPPPPPLHSWKAVLTRNIRSPYPCHFSVPALQMKH